MNSEERRRAIQSALVQMDKQFGKGAVLLLGSRNAVPVTTISTGSLSVDNALGVGGLPRGRVIEIYGPESSGKTTLTLHVIAEAQKAGGYAAFIDAEVLCVDSNGSRQPGARALRQGLPGAGTEAREDRCLRSTGRVLSSIQPVQGCGAAGADYNDLSPCRSSEAAGRSLIPELRR